MNWRLPKDLLSEFPSSWQRELKRIKYAYQIRHNTFQSSEPEFKRLDAMISAGDWVVDVGANVGHYTRKFSELVGPRGRVIAIEPEDLYEAASKARLNQRSISVSATFQRRPP